LLQRTTEHCADTTQHILVFILRTDLAILARFQGRVKLLPYRQTLISIIPLRKKGIRSIISLASSAGRSPAAGEAAADGKLSDSFSVVCYIFPMNRATQVGSTLFVAGSFIIHALTVKIPVGESLLHTNQPHAEERPISGNERILRNPSPTVTVSGAAMYYSPEILPAIGSGTMPE